MHFDEETKKEKSCKIMLLRFENTSAERIIVTLDASGWWPVGCAKEGHLSPLLLLS